MGDREKAVNATCTGDATHIGVAGSDEMKKQPSSEESIREFISEMIEKVTQEEEIATVSFGNLAMT